VTDVLAGDSRSLEEKRPDGSFFYSFRVWFGGVCDASSKVILHGRRLVRAFEEASMKPLTFQVSSCCWITTIDYRCEYRRKVGRLRGEIGAV
jgi:hypothetical protein